MANGKKRKKAQQTAKAEVLSIQKPCEISDKAQSEAAAIRKQEKNWGLLGYWKKPKRIKCFTLGVQHVELRQHGNCLSVDGLSQNEINKSQGSKQRYAGLAKKLKNLGFVWVRKGNGRRQTGWVLDTRRDGWNQQPWLTQVWATVGGENAQHDATSMAYAGVLNVIGRHIGQSREHNENLQQTVEATQNLQPVTKIEW